MKKATKILFLSIFCLGFFGWAEKSFADTHTANTCSQADVQAAVNSSTNGDTVQVPAGSCSWDIDATNNIVIPAGVNLAGAGRDGDGTNITITSYAQPSYNNFGIRIQTGSILSGFYFNGGSVAGLLITGDGANIRVHNNKFTNFESAGRPISFREFRGNVVDNNIFYACGVDVSANSEILSWISVTGFGTNDFTFIENNIFYNTGVQSCQRPVEVGNGHKVVMRYNTVHIDSSSNFSNHLLDAHGYCHGSSSRATRAVEIYNNEILQSAPQDYARNAVYLRGGTGVVYNNKWRSDAQYVGSAIDLYDWRFSINGDATDGTNCYAVVPNVLGKTYCWQNGYRVALPVNADTLYASPPSAGKFEFGSTLIGGSSGAFGVIIGFEKESPSHLYFYSITNGPFISGEDLIVDGTKITTAATNSEAYSGEGYPCTDQVGRGNNQANEPYYFWNNKDENDVLTGVSVPNSLSGYIQSSIEYIDNGATPMPGYFPYICPHPLTGFSGSCDSDVAGTNGYNIAISDTTSPAAPSGLSVQ